MKPSTVVDTIALQVEYNNEFDCYDAQIDINTMLEQYGYYCFNGEVQYKYKKIAKVTKASYGTQSNKHMSPRVIHYLSIEIAGLKRYSPLIDIASYNCLILIASYLNTHNTFFNITQLDVALDVKAKFEQILALCVKRSPTTRYYKANEQLFETTRYIEKFRNKKHKGEAVLHACLYCKTTKHDLNFNLTRFEVSFQKAFFKRDGINFGRISKELERYYVIKVRSKKKQREIQELYDSKDVLRQKDIKELGIDGYRVHVDINKVIDLIQTIYSVKDPFVDAYVLPM